MLGTQRSRPVLVDGPAVQERLRGRLGEDQAGGGLGRAEDPDVRDVERQDTEPRGAELEREGEHRADTGRACAAGA